VLAGYYLSIVTGLGTVLPHMDRLVALLTLCPMPDITLEPGIEVSRLAGLLLQQLRYLCDGLLPTFVLIDGHVFKGFNHRSRYVLSLQIGFENVDVAI
jgi:hypothetical protein